MDPTIQELLNKLGIEAGKQAIQAVIRQWEERKRRKLDAAKNKAPLATAVQQRGSSRSDPGREPRGVGTLPICTGTVRSVRSILTMTRPSSPFVQTDVYYSAGL
jgi:hypothetical protein